MGDEGTEVGCCRSLTDSCFFFFFFFFESGTHEIDFEAENRTLRQENHDLQTENVDLSLLVQDYETVLEKVLEGLRIYAV